MKLNSTAIVMTSMVIAAGVSAECPSQLSAENTYECVMMEGNDDGLNYRKWVPEFYKEFNPGKAAAINAAYKSTVFKTKPQAAEHEKISALSRVAAE